MQSTPPSIHPPRVKLPKSQPGQTAPDPMQIPELSSSFIPSHAMRVRMLVAPQQPDKPSWIRPAALTSGIALSSSPLSLLQLPSNARFTPTPAHIAS